MATLKEIGVISGTTALLTLGGVALRSCCRDPETKQPATPKIYSLEAERVSQYFRTLEDKLQFLADLLNMPPTIPFANEKGNENDILVTGRIQKLRENIFCGNFHDGDVIFEGKKEAFRATLTERERQRLFEMMGVSPDTEELIYNCRKIETIGDDVVISDLYRIGVYGLSESHINAIDENICSGQYNILAIRDWRKEKSKWIGNQPVEGERADPFVNIRVNSNYVNFSVRDYADIIDRRTKTGNSSITFFDDRTESKIKKTNKKYLQDIKISSETPPNIVSYRRRNGESYTELRMNPPFTVDKTYTNRSRNCLPDGGRGR